MATIRAVLGATILAALLGCGTADPGGGPDLPDPGADDAPVATDTPAQDPSGDPRPDTPPDPAADAPPDLPADAPPDLPADAPPDVPAATGPVRFAIVSDTHLWADDTVQANRNWIQAATALAGQAAPPERVFATGDDVDDLFTAPFALQDWLDGAGDEPEVLGAIRRLADDHLPVAYRIVLGNHDNRYFDTFEGNALPLAAWAKAFAGSPAYPGPWYAEEIRGCRFVVLQSTELATNHADNDTPTFGAVQLAWLEEQLSGEGPAVVFWHHWIPPPAEGEDPPPVLQALARHAGPGDRVVFTGHGHEFHRAAWSGIRLYETGALVESPDFVQQVECDGSTGRIRVLNEADLPWMEGPLDGTP